MKSLLFTLICFLSAFSSPLMAQDEHLSGPRQTPKGNRLNWDLCKSGTPKEVQAEVDRFWTYLRKKKGTTDELYENIDPGLRYAAKYNPDPEVVRILVSGKARVWTQHRRRLGSGSLQGTGYSLNSLSLAAKFNNAQVVEALLKKGMEDLATEALMYASRYNSNEEVIDVLIKAGARAGAGWRDSLDSEKFQILERVMNIHGISVLNYQPSHSKSLYFNSWNGLSLDDREGLVLMATRHSTSPISLHGRLRSYFFAENLTDGENMTRASKNYKKFRSEPLTPLMLASRWNENPKVVERLLKVGLDQDFEHGVTAVQTPLMYAASRNPNPEVLRVLIEGGLDVNTRDRQGMTALMYAARYNTSLGIHKLLIESGAKVNTRDAQGRSSIHYATENENAKVLATLIEAGGKINVIAERGESPLVMAMFNPNYEIHMVLISAGADLNERPSEENWTPLMFAARHNPNPEVIKVLLGAGADVNVKTNWTKRASGTTALNLAARENNEKVVEALVEAGADLSPKTPSSPLMLAAAWNPTPEVLEVLISAGANVNEKSGTPLLNAVRQNSPDVVAVLLKHGADVNANDSILLYAKNNPAIRGSDVFWELNDASRNQ